MNIVPRVIGLTAILLTCAPPPSGIAQIQNVQISVDGSPAGHGVAISRGLDCFVITANHVVASEGPIRVLGVGRRSSGGKIHWSEPAVDLAVIDVAAPANICGRDFFIKVAGLSGRLAENPRGTLRLRNEHGEEYEIAVTLRRSLAPIVTTVAKSLAGSIRIQSLDPSNQLGQGLSGSMLYVANEPSGILLEVSTDGQAIGRVLPIDRIHSYVGHFLPLVEPDEDRARFDEPLAGDILRKNINFMLTDEFCVSLLRMARYVSKPDSQLTYVSKARDASGDNQFNINSWLLPGRVTVWRVSPDRTQRSAKTRIGIVPSSMNLDEQWSAAEGAIARCIDSDVRKQLKLRQRGEMTRSRVDKRSQWELERTGFGGLALGPTVHLWLGLGVRDITIHIWSWD